MARNAQIHDPFGVIALVAFAFVVGLFFGMPLETAIPAIGIVWAALVLNGE